MSKRAKELVPGEPYASLAKAETRKVKVRLNKNDSGALRGSPYWVMWALANMVVVLTLTSVLALHPAFIALGVLPMGISLFSLLIDYLCDGDDSISGQYKKIVRNILDDYTPQNKRPNRGLMLSSGKVTRAPRRIQEVVTEPRYFRALNPTAIVFPQVVGKKHIYEPDKGIHTVISLTSNGFRVNATTETYLNDRAVFNRALDKLEEL